MYYRFIFYFNNYHTRIKPFLFNYLLQHNTAEDIFDAIQIQYHSLVELIHVYVISIIREPFFMEKTLEYILITCI